METISVSEAKQLDDKTIHQVGLDSIVLMERAALSIYDDLTHNNGWNLNNILILAGYGNNGGDALALARILFTHHFNVTILPIGFKDNASEENKKQQFSCDYYHIPLTTADADFSQYTTIIDGIFGVGLSREVSNDFATVIEKANQANVPIHAIDIPSGLNGDTGQPMGTAIKATSTSTLSYVKTGMALDEAQQYVGQIFIDDIGIYKTNTFNNE